VSNTLLVYERKLACTPRGGVACNTSVECRCPWRHEPERYRSLAPMYYRGAAAAIVVFDVTRPDSFLGAKHWVRELHRRQPTVIVLVGNKRDLVAKRQVGAAEALEYAAEHHLAYFDVSSKTNFGVADVLIHIANELPAHVANIDNAFTVLMEPPQRRWWQSNATTFPGLLRTFRSHTVLPATCVGLRRT